MSPFFNTLLYRNALYLIMSNLVVPITGFIFWVIVARIYLPEEVGLASAVIAVITLLATLSTLGLEFAVIRFLPQSDNNTNLKINSYLTVSILSALFFCVIFLIGLKVWSPALLFLYHETVFLTTFVIFTITYTVCMIVVNIFVARRRAGFALLHSFILATLRLPLPVILAFFFGTFGILASWGLSWITALVVSLLILLPKVEPGYRPLPVIRWSVVREIAHFSFTNYLANLLWMIPSLVLPIMVLNMLGSELNAYFYIAWTVGNVLATIPLSISMSLFAEGSTDEKSLRANIKRSFKLTFIILVPAVMLMLFFADKLLLIFGATYSQEGAMLLRVLALAALPIGVNYIYISIKRVQKKLAALMGVGTFIVTATLVASYLLLPQISIIGGGVAWLGSQGALALWIISRFLMGKR